MKKLIIVSVSILLIILAASFATYRVTINNLQITQTVSGYQVMVFGQTDNYK